ncbi:protein LEG1 homolog [Aulostomus maculatus]
MLRPTGLCLLLACVVSLGSSAVVVENGMPILWAQTAAQIGDLPAQDGIVTPDPWNFIHRMSFYRLIIEATNTYMGPVGTGPTDSPIWGLPLQLGWMLTSGRLADPTSATTCGLPTGDTTCISTQSWWGCVNYFTSALPFLAAAQQGLMGPGVQVKMQAPAGVEEYCTTYADCATLYSDVLNKWSSFYQNLKDSTGSSLPANENRDALLGLYWEAHMSSIAASPACSAKLSSYSPVEVSFAEGWLNSANFVSAARFQSSLEKSILFLAPLPGRILLEGDSALPIADLSPEENHTLSTFSWMKLMDQVLRGMLTNMWNTAMCSVTSREKGQEMLEQLLLNSTFAPETFVSIVTATNC